MLRPPSVPGRAVDQAIDLGRLLFSKETHRELLSVIRRPKFDRYVRLDRRVAFLVRLDDLIDWVQPMRAIRACRDPKDDKFLEAAVHGSADALITGDADLLALHPFHDIPILSPDRFLFGLAPPGAAGLVQEPAAAYRTRRPRTATSTAKN